MRMPILHAGTDFDNHVNVQAAINSYIVYEYNPHRTNYKLCTMRKRYIPGGEPCPVEVSLTRRCSRACNTLHLPYLYTLHTRENTQQTLLRYTWYHVYGTTNDQ